MTGKWLGAGLIASLALNLFLLAGAGVMLTRRADAPAKAPSPIAAAADRLTPEHGKDFRRMVRREMRALAPQAREARTARREAAQALSQASYDEAKINAALARARAAEAEVRTGVETAVVRYAAGLTAEERAGLAVVLRRGGIADKRAGVGGRRHGKRDKAERAREAPPASR